MKNNSGGALTGVRVADFTQLVQGPWATQMLGDMGADIIKIEPPGGDWMRHYAYGNLYPAGESISFLGFNRNKRSIALDLKSPEGLQAARDIISRSDIVIENFRPGVMDRLGIGYEALQAKQPGLIYCASSGYGKDGPYRTRPGQDLLAQSLAGGAWLNGRSGDIPVVTAVGQADLLTSLFIVQSVLAALYYREQTGKGQRIDASLLNSIIAFHTQEITAYLYKGENPERSTTGIPNPWLGAPYGLYPTKDSYIAIGMNSVRRLAAIMGMAGYDREAFDGNNIIESRDAIYADFAEVFRTKTTADWLELLLPHDIWCSQVNTFKEMAVDPQVRHNSMIVEYDHPTAGKVSTTGIPVQFSMTPAGIRRPAPLLGEHTAEVLKDVCGYTEGQVQAIVQSLKKTS
jgi:crotonobetainyl-CoA:carnitine CoA-transferase CaiB-like acyl-CoA transferase